MIDDSLGNLSLETHFHHVNHLGMNMNEVTLELHDVLHQTELH